MVYDARRQQVVLFCWVGSNGTYAWDGATWKLSQKATGSLPTRYEFAAVWDDTTSHIVLFGGQGGGMLNDTWEWTGRTWIQRFPWTAPPARHLHAMAYDRKRRRIVLFGGQGGGMLNDTWEWDGTNWTQSAPASRPAARMQHAMAYDAARGQVVLFGGYDGIRYFGDTWTWNGTVWTQHQPVNSPPARFSAGLAYDRSRQRIVLFGGYSGGPGGLNDTWEWDGSNWTQQTSASTTPARRWEPGLAYDTVRERVVLHGGRLSVYTPHNRSPSLSHDTWEWDGVSWTQVQTRNTPPTSLWFLPIVYDKTRGAMVLCHAGDREVWAYSTHELTLSNPLVSVATGAAVTLSIDAGLAHAGKSYRVAGCMDAPSPKGIPLGRITLPLHPDPYFWLTLQSPELVITGATGTLDSTGKATASIRVPALPAAFAGLRFLHAFVVFQTQLEHASVPMPLTLVR